MPIPDGWVEAETKRTWYLVIDGISRLSVNKSASGWSATVVEIGFHDNSADAMAVAAALWKMGV